MHLESVTEVSCNPRGRKNRCTVAVEGRVASLSVTCTEALRAASPASKQFLNQTKRKHITQASILCPARRDIMVLEVVCPGYGRTGTNSLKEALEILGFGPTYHMVRIIDKHMDTHPQLWIDGYQGRGLQMSKIFDDYKAVTDWPASDFYQEITKAYPDAKVVLTTRDPNSWWESIKDTVHIHAPVTHTWGRFFLQAFVPRFRRFWYMIRHIATLHMEETEAKADFLRHNAQVKATIPAEKLLEFSVKDGWQPLCTFLGVPVPKVPFPKSNSREEITQRMTRLGKIGWIVMLSAIAATGISVGVSYIIGGRHFGGIIAAMCICFLSSCVMEATRVSQFYGKKAS